MKKWNDWVSREEFPHLFAPSLSVLRSVLGVLLKVLSSLITCGSPYLLVWQHKMILLVGSIFCWKMLTMLFIKPKGRGVIKWLYIALFEFFDDALRASVSFFLWRRVGKKRILLLSLRCRRNLIPCKQKNHRYQRWFVCRNSELPTLSSEGNWLSRSAGTKTVLPV